ncbi:MAG: hypothetical protein M0R76_02010 [Proteobacteria bacterium]|nr:hypothetical protein [Pseudomonadota bacterium]
MIKAFLSHLAEKDFEPKAGVHTGISYSEKFKYEDPPYVKVRPKRESAKILAEVKANPEAYALSKLKKSKETILPQVIVTEFAPGEVIHEGVNVIGEIRVVWDFEGEMKKKLEAEKGIDFTLLWMRWTALSIVSVPFIIYFVVTGMEKEFQQGRREADSCYYEYKDGMPDQIVIGGHKYPVDEMGDIKKGIMVNPWHQNVISSDKCPIPRRYPRKEPEPEVPEGDDYEEWK